MRIYDLQNPWKRGKQKLYALETGSSRQKGNKYIMEFSITRGEVREHVRKWSPTQLYAAQRFFFLFMSSLVSHSFILFPPSFYSSLHANNRTQERLSDRIKRQVAFQIVFLASEQKLGVVCISKEPVARSPAAMKSLHTQKNDPIVTTLAVAPRGSYVLVIWPGYRCWR